MKLVGLYGHNFGLINMILLAVKLMGHIKIRNNVITVRERWILHNKYILFCFQAEYYTRLRLESRGKGRDLLPEQSLRIRQQVLLHPRSPSLPRESQATA